MFWMVSVMFHVKIGLGSTGHMLLIYISISLSLSIYLYTSSIYLALPANVNMKHYRSLSNFALVGPLISFWQPKQLSQDVANIKSHTLPHAHVVCNAHPVTWTPYAKFQPYWSINEFLVGIMTSYGCGNDQTTPIDNAYVICNAHLVARKPNSKFQWVWSFD